MQALKDSDSNSIKVKASSAFVLCAAFFALAAPVLVAAHLPPSSTFLNQAIALFGWGLFVLAWSMEQILQPTQSRQEPTKTSGFLALQGALPWALVFSPNGRTACCGQHWACWL
jgi:hypothetical protein